MRYSPFFFFFCFASVLLEAVSPGYSSDHPWLTGPLLTPSARVVKGGHFLLEPYIYRKWITAEYGKDWEAIPIPVVHQWNPLILIKIGMTEHVNFSCVPQVVINTVKHKTFAGFGDFPLGFEIQLYNDGSNFIKVAIQEIFPTGKFQNLDPDKFGTDSIGQGSFTTQFSLALAKLFDFKNDHYLSLRLNLVALISSPVPVKGYNSYGGDFTTKGTLFPGSAFNLFFGAEYTLTENIALALDIATLFDDRDRFKGTTITTVGFPSAANISMAPAIEYNWNANIGLIVGSWFTVAGKNSIRFTSAVAALNIYY